MTSRHPHYLLLALILGALVLIAKFYGTII